MTKHPFAPDSRPRCEWSYGGMSEAYIRYHDEEWGVPAPVSYTHLTLPTILLV